MENIKILHANDDNYNLGGAFLITYRVEKYLRKYGYSYDYLSMDKFVENSLKFPIPSDDVTYSANLRKNRLLGHLKLPFFVNKVLKLNNYKIIHIDTDSAWKGLLYAVPAKKNGVKVVLHSHSTNIDGSAKTLKRMCERIAKAILPNYVDSYLACSKEAAKWLAPYGNLEKIKVVFNGIDFSNFYYNEEERIKIREQYNIGKSILIGNVALLMERKNQMFIIKILESLLKKGVDAKVILVGDDNNDYGKMVKKYLIDKSLESKVIFTGLDNRVREFLNAMDVFLLPSLFEGAPLASYESQATGLYTILSDSISSDAIITQWCSKLSLNEEIEKWTELVLEYTQKNSVNRKNRLIDEKYSINEMARNIAQTYEELV